MIVAMKKVWIVCLARDAGQAVADLRRVGVMHVEHQQLPQGKDIAALTEDIATAQAALDILAQCPDGASAAAPKAAPDWKLAGKHVIDLAKRLEHLADFSHQLRSKIAEMEPWGDFDPHAIGQLAHQNVFIRFYQIPAGDVSAAAAEGSIVRTVCVRGGIAHCVVISRHRHEIPFREIPLPKESLSVLRQRLQQDTLVEKALRKDLVRHADHYADIRAHRDALRKQLEFHQALAGMGQDGPLGYIKGYVPHDRLPSVEREAGRQRWGLLVEDPAEDDPVPTLLRQPRWVAVIRPLLDFLGITPGYRELDVSPTFLIFFSVFFGILIGDAGYGLTYLLLTRFVVRRKLGARYVSTITLLYVLSWSAIAWGALTGTFFGQGWLTARGIHGLVPLLNDAKSVQTLCFFLGALQLSIAHSWRTVLKLPSLSALADTGWLLIVWAAFFLARTLILGDPFPAFGKFLIFGGIGLVILFTNPQKNMLKSIGEGAGAIALGLVNSFTDVVSYIRLFAVGMAGVAIAEATNGMSAASGNSIAAAVIVVIGHALNLVMGPLSVLVHGVRLNILEFSGHAGVSWNGQPYAPLAE